MYRSPLILRRCLNGIHVTEIYPNGFIFVPVGPQWDKGSFLSRSVSVVKSLILAQSARCVGNRSFVNFDILSLARYRLDAGIQKPIILQRWVSPCT